MASSRTILLDGYYGARNIGDELILTSLIHLIRKRGKRTNTEYEIIVSSHDPKFTMAHHDVDGVVPRFFPKKGIQKQWLQAVSAADEFWIGGGGLFGPQKMLKYTASVSIARSVNTRVATLGVGVRPFINGPKHSRRLVCEFARHIDSITVRDKDSADALREVGVSKPIHVVADPVFGYDPEEVKGIKVPQNIRQRLDSDTILVSVREPEVRQLDRAALIRSLNRVIESTDVSLLFVPFHTAYSSNDIRIASEIAEMVDRSDQVDVVRQEIGFREMVPIINEASLVVGMRLHSIITAAVVGTPVIGIAYHPKCESILRQLNQKQFEWCDTIDSNRLAASIIEAWKGGTPEVEIAASELHKRAQSLIETAESSGTACSRVRTPMLMSATIRAGLEKAIR